jgi:hypothetical protein
LEKILDFVGKCVAVKKRKWMKGLRIGIESNSVENRMLRHFSLVFMGVFNIFANKKIQKYLI